jgi:glycosyltransferase 2 family protein
MKKYLFKIFLYLSLLFLGIALFKANYLVIPKIVSTNSVIISILLLVAGFVVNTIAWSVILIGNKMKIRLIDGITSIGLSIFGKYIPGKLWVILGRSEYVAGKYGFSRKKVGIISLHAQLISIWTGLILGSIGLLFIDAPSAYGWMVLALFVLLSLIIFTNFFNGLAENFIGLFKKQIEIPRVSFISVITVIPWYFVNWLLWSLSFYFLVSALYGETIPLISGLGFALAGSLGIVAVIAPGGIGIREGILTFYLTFLGLGIEEATTISIVSRLWFLCGEIFIFLTGLALRTIGVSKKGKV